MTDDSIGLWLALHSKRFPNILSPHYRFYRRVYPDYGSLNPISAKMPKRAKLWL